MSDDGWLARSGGAVLLVLGVALVALAVLIDREPLASGFLVLGVATAVLGVVLERLEGPLELTATGLKANILRRARAVAQDEALTLEDKGEVLTDLLLPSGRRRGTDGAGERLQRPERPTPPQDGDEEQPLLPDIAPFDWDEVVAADRVSLRHVGRELEAHVRNAFQAAGWKFEGRTAPPSTTSLLLVTATSNC